MKHSRALAMLLAVATVALAACSNTPRKEPAPTTAVRIENHGEFDGRKHASRRSPYAPAKEDPGKRGNYTPGGLYAPGVSDSAPAGGIPDIELIPEPEVRDEPRSRYGNRSPYTVLGKSYRVLDHAAGYDETGLASYYGNKFHGRRTSNLEVYDMYAFTAAHKTLPLPSYARVTNLANGRSVVVRVNDRGPFHDGRIIDLSYAAAVKLGVDQAGTARVEVQGLSAGENARQQYDAVATETAPATPTPAPSAIDRLVGALPIAAAAAGERLPPSRLQSSSGPAATGSGWRFDMRQDGRTMSADEFDAWMRARRARVATGKPGVPEPRVATRTAAPDSATDAAAANNPPPATRTTGVTLQVASFAAHANAERALAMLAGAGIDGARLLDADANGRRVWRLRVGPVAADVAPALVARIQGLGFGQPQRVRE